MSQLKTIIFIFLLCLLFPAAEVFALNTGKIVIPEIKLPQMANLCSSLDNTLNRASASIDRTKSHVKSSLDGTMGNIRKSLNGTMDGIDEFFADAGDIADVAAAAGAIFIFMMAATNDNCYFYDYNWNGGYDHSWPRSYDPWR